MEAADRSDLVRFGRVWALEWPQCPFAYHCWDVLYAAWRKKRANNKPRAKGLFEGLHMVGMLIQQCARLEPFAVECHFVGAGGPISEEERSGSARGGTAAPSRQRGASRPSDCCQRLPRRIGDGCGYLRRADP